MKKVLLYLGKGSSTPNQRKSDSDSAARIRWSFLSGTDASKNKNLVAGPSPDGETGSKDEAFFDSQAWLESDNEDFYSVQGENSPCLLKASPVHQKKSLSELFCESFDSKRGIDQSILSETLNAASSLQRKKSSGSARHCFPGLVRSLSCREWKKKQKRLSPVHVA